MWYHDTASVTNPKSGLSSIRHFFALRAAHSVVSTGSLMMRLVHHALILSLLVSLPGLAWAQTTEPLPLPEAPAPQEAPPADEQISPDDMSLGEIPIVETMELSPDTAKRAIDVYILVKEKYKDADLEGYDSLQDFVDQNAEGKAFESDIKKAGFNSVNDWNLAITTVGFAYTGVINDQSDDIKLQIEEIRADTELAQDMKDRMAASLTAMIPSDNNRKVIQDLMNDPAYAEKLKQLDTEEE